MTIQLKLFKTYLLPSIICMTVLLFAAGCKKDRITVDQSKQYSQVGHLQMNAYDGGWGLTLQPEGVADLSPGGDIVYRGTYKINGSKLKVTTSQNSGSYTFEIISDTQIREKKYGVILELIE